jgi:hypothetical protein
MLPKLFVELYILSACKSRNSKKHKFSLYLIVPLCSWAVFVLVLRYLYATLLGKLKADNKKMFRNLWDGYCVNIALQPEEDFDIIAELEGLVV